jgi:hypothetical protein
MIAPASGPSNGQVPVRAIDEHAERPHVEAGVPGSPVEPLRRGVAGVAGERDPREEGLWVVVRNGPGPRGEQQPRDLGDATGASQQHLPGGQVAVHEPEGVEGLDPRERLAGERLDLWEGERTAREPLLEALAAEGEDDQRRSPEGEEVEGGQEVLVLEGRLERAGVAQAPAQRAVGLAGADERHGLAEAEDGGTPTLRVGTGADAREDLVATLEHEAGSERRGAQGRWALGWRDTLLPFDAKDESGQVLPASRFTSEAVRQATLRPANEILDQLDAVYCRRWIIVDAQQRGAPLPPGLLPPLLLERHHALLWLNGRVEWDEVRCST